MAFGRAATRIGQFKKTIALSARSYCRDDMSTLQVHGITSWAGRFPDVPDEYILRSQPLTLLENSTHWVYKRRLARQRVSPCMSKSAASCTPKWRMKMYEYAPVPYCHGNNATPDTSSFMRMNANQREFSRGRIGTLSGGDSSGDNICEHCGARFMQRFRLRQHIDLHTRPYRCCHCSWSFSKLSELKRHEFRHLFLGRSSNSS